MSLADRHLGSRFECHVTPTACTYFIMKVSNKYEVDNTRLLMCKKAWDFIKALKTAYEPDEGEIESEIQCDVHDLDKNWAVLTVSIKIADPV